MRRTTLEFPGEPMVLRTDDGGITVSIPIRVRRYSGRRQVVVPQGIAATLGETRAPTALQVALARGHRWLRQIESGQARNIAELADREKIDRSYVSHMINLTTLAPDIQAAILNETLPEEVALFDLAADTPQCWEAQRRRIDEVVAKAREGKTRAVAQT
ncbi:LacI family transcriptional regulator [Ralstonia syzygii]|uniref:Putative phage-related protein n=1 Tax=Ralstonia syzygii R24 TaxID=907261 RepID=G3A5J2_9RALS|nr:LacI family transcriptional regulator [Ralstonia syzygii]CCA89224.1 putative phage-related protein [Ralstonia syzygii R24]